MLAPPGAPASPWPLPDAGAAAGTAWPPGMKKLESDDTGLSGLLCAPVGDCTTITWGAPPFGIGYGDIGGPPIGGGGM